MIGIRCESDRLVAVAEQVAEMPEVDYVVITAGTYDLLIETVCEDNEALLRFLAETPAGDRRRPRDRDVRVPADGQADLPVGDALTANRVARAHRRTAARIAPDGTGRCGRRTRPKMAVCRSSRSSR